MQIQKINIEKPLCYFKSGQFQGSRGWQHKQMYLDGDYEIILGLKHEFYMSINGVSYTVKPGDVYIIPPYITYEGNAPSNDDLSFYWLHFIPRLTANTYTLEETLDALYFGDAAILTALRKEPPADVYLPLHFHAPAPEKLYILMKQILDVSHSNYYSSYCIDYLVTSLALEITQQFYTHCMAQKVRRTAIDHPLSQILEWIRINIYCDLTVRMIADHFSFSPDYLTRLFKKHLGIATNKYINMQKINAVKGLLSTTDYSAKEIAYMMNFKDEKYLMRLFKSKEGITLSQYRNAYKNTYFNNGQVDPTIPLPANVPKSKV